MMPEDVEVTADRIVTVVNACKDVFRDTNCDLNIAFQASLNLVVQILGRAAGPDIAIGVLRPMLDALADERPDWHKDLLPVMEALEPFNKLSVMFHDDGHAVH